MESYNEKEVIYNKKYKKVFNQPIGSGSFSSVYLVENILDHKKYLKFLYECI